MDDVNQPNTVMIDRAQMEAAARVVDAARALLAIAPPEGLEQLVGRVAVRNLRGAIASLDAYPTRRLTSG